MIKLGSLHAIDLVALRALAMVLRLARSSARRALHVTPSAISQRVRALEDRLGCMLVVRASPAEPRRPRARGCTGISQDRAARGRPARGSAAAGRGRSGRPSQHPDRGQRRQPGDLGAAGVGGFPCPHRRHGGAGGRRSGPHPRWLKNGTVIGAVTTAAEPLAGCRVDALGQMSSRRSSPAFRAPGFEDERWWGPQRADAGVQPRT